MMFAVCIHTCHKTLIIQTVYNLHSVAVWYTQVKYLFKII